MSLFCMTRPRIAVVWAWHFVFLVGRHAGGPGSRCGYSLRHEQEGTQLSGTASGAIFQCLCPKLHSWGVSPSLSLPSPLKKEFFSLLLLKQQQLGSPAWGRVALQNCFASFRAGHLFFCVLQDHLIELYLNFYYCWLYNQSSGFPRSHMTWLLTLVIRF